MRIVYRGFERPVKNRSRFYYNTMLQSGSMFLNLSVESGQTSFEKELLFVIQMPGLCLLCLWRRKLNLTDEENKSLNYETFRNSVRSWI